MGDRASPPAFEFASLIQALTRGDDATARAEAQRALTAGAVPPASTIMELVALVLWREARQEERTRRVPVARPLLVRHLRLAAAAGERWAAAWLGLDGYLSWDAPDGHPVPSLTAEERTTFLRRAAAAGHRRAQFALARSIRDQQPDASGVLELLRMAYADGTPDTVPSSAELGWGGTWRAPDSYPATDDVLADIALEAALSAVAVGRQAEAEQWFDRACYVDEWEGQDTLRTRSWARLEYARWCDEQNRPGQADAIREMLVDEASSRSLTASRWMHSEWKRYRIAWQFERDRESARHHALRASLTGQAMSTPPIRERLVTVLSDNYFLSDDDAPVVREYLDRTRGGIGFRAQLRWHILGDRHGADSTAAHDAGADRDAVTAVLWWLLRDFQSSWLDLLGLPGEAEALRGELDAASRAPSPYPFKDAPALQGPEGVLARVEEYRSARRIVRERLLGDSDPSLRPLGRATPACGLWSRALGLSGTRRHYTGCLHEIPALRGTPLGMSLWLAGGRESLKALDALDWELNELLATVHEALDRRDSSPPLAGGASKLGGTLEAERRRDGIVRSHLHAQREAFEALVAQLTR